MTNRIDTIGPDWSIGWIKSRLSRHITEMTRLALPVMTTRLGVWAITMVDTAVVGNYATHHLAWLNLANQTVIMVLFVVAIGLLMGVQVQVSKAYGAGKLKQCGQIWRRTLPFTALISVFILLVSIPGPFWLRLIGIEEPMVSEAGRLIQIISLGLPFHLLFIQTTMFFEGINRAMVGVGVMVIANIVNLFADLVLVFGWGGFDPLGAEGAAWASTIVRATMAITVISYLWFSPSVKQFGVRNPVRDRWKDWAHQRSLGYANATSMTAEILAFSALAIFAGYLSQEAVASHGIIFAIIGVPLMLAIGVSTATSVRVAIAAGRGDSADTMLAGYVGLGFGFMLMVLLALGSYIGIAPLTAFFTSDQKVMDIVVPIAALFCSCMVIDSCQMIAAGALRGFGETWWPTAIMVAIFNGVMIPSSYWLAIPLGRGVGGLFEATFIACTLALVLLTIRFYIATRRVTSAVVD